MVGWLSYGHRLAVMGMPGQAARELGHTMHRACRFLLAVLLLVTVAAGGLAWRLSRGPLDLSFLTGRVETAFNKAIDPVHVSIGGFSIAWNGFRQGVNQPLALRMTGVTVAGMGDGAAIQLPAVETTLSVRGLLSKRIIPRTLALEGVRVTMTRQEDGSIYFNMGDTGAVQASNDPSPLAGLLAMLEAPATTDIQAGGGPLSQLTSISIRGAALTLDDRRLGTTWSAPTVDVELSRRAGGGLDGRATLVLALAGQKADLTATFTTAGVGQASHVTARLSQITPKALSATIPALAPLAALNAPVSLDLEADLGPDLALAHFRLTARGGAGTANTHGGAIPLRRSEFVLAGTPEEAAIETAVIELQPKPGGPLTTLTAKGTITHRAKHFGATLKLALDRFNFADLSQVWPPGIAPPARAWVTENIVGGVARDGKVELTLDAAEDFSTFAVTRAAGTLEGDDITSTWLLTVPPVEQGKARLVLVDPDKVEIVIRTARQTVRDADPIAIRDGLVTITGLARKDQVATIKAEIVGSVASTIALLKEPKLKLLDRHPLDMRDPAGDIRATLLVVIPLENKVDIDDITIHATCTLSKVHLGGIVAGRDIDDGTASIDVDTKHLLVKGTARVANIPAVIEGMMDFRSGPPTQVTQRYKATGRASAQALAAAGLDLTDVVGGEAGLSVNLTQLRNGESDMVVDADLTAASLTLAPLNWVKPVGVAVKASARLKLQKDKLESIERVVVNGQGVMMRGTVTVSGGRVDGVRMERVVLGRSDLSGTIRFPRNAPVSLELSGPSLDIATKILEKTPKRERGAPEPAATTMWSLKGRFNTVFLANDQSATNIAVIAEHDGHVIQSLIVTGASGSGKAFSAEIGRGQKGRWVSVNVLEAGSLLKGLDITDTIQEGALILKGMYDDTIPARTLTGTIEMGDFRVARAVTLGKLLQAVTLYGLVDALSGPGLSFSKLNASFQFNDAMAQVWDARAFSASLGVTVKGTVDRISNRLELDGTLVPAYVFNSLLGRIPVLGRLFANEEGGGLIAMNYSLRGNIDDPSIMVNPLSALTPGVLRRMFNVLD